MTKSIAALYLRAARLSDDAIEAQRQSCAAYAASLGWRVGEIFVENGANGMRDRPGLAALTDCIREGPEHAWFARNQMRIAREFSVVDEFTRYCKVHGASIAYVEDPGKPVERTNFILQKAVKKTEDKKPNVTGNDAPRTDLSAILDGYVGSDVGAKAASEHS